MSKRDGEHQAAVEGVSAPTGPYIAPGLAASAAVSVAVLAGLLSLFPLNESAQATAVSLARYLNNDFCLAILALGFWVVTYGVLQVYGAALEARALVSKQESSRLIRRLTAALDADMLMSGEGANDPSLKATVAADRFEANRSLRLAPINYAIWVLPLLGFIGTVIGISGAIGGLGGVFAEAGREEALTGVLADLRYAFDTTFVGLAMVIPAMGIATIYRTRSDAVRHILVRRALDTPEAG